MTSELRNRLVKVLGMLGSPHDGERAAAGLLATKLLTRAGLMWDTVLAVPAGPWTTAEPVSSATPRPASAEQPRKKSTRVYDGDTVHAYAYANGDTVHAYCHTEYAYGGDYEYTPPPKPRRTRSRKGTTTTRGGT
jgi:hypothetical protein